MTKFEKSKFTLAGGYLHYEGKFVARFKYNRSNAAGFKSFLTKNFTVEEFFDLTVNKNLAPVTALETKGYVSAVVQKSLKKLGYEPTQAGLTAYLSRGV